MISKITDRKYRDEWNRAVNHPLQTWEWGEVKEKFGNRVIHLGEFDGQKRLVRGYLFTVHPLPFGLTAMNYARGYWPSDEAFGFLKRVMAEEKAVFLKLEPDVFKEEAGILKVPLLKKRWKGADDIPFVLSGSRLFAGHTFILDLDFSEGELLARMKSKTRYNIRLSAKKGVEVRDETGNNEGFGTFFRLYRETIRRQKYLGHNEAYHRYVWDIFKEQGMARILVAYYQNEPVAAYQLFFFKNRAYYLYGGSSMKHKEVMASNLLMWEAIRLAKRQKCHSFDMWGALPKDYKPDDPWAGFHRFKEGYGGLHRTYLPTIDIVDRPVEYGVFSVAWPVRVKILELLS